MSIRVSKYDNKNKNEEIQRYKICQIISQYMEEFLKEMEIKKSKYQERINDQKILEYDSDEERKKVIELKNSKEDQEKK